MVEEYSAAQFKNMIDSSETVMVLCAHPNDTDCMATALAWNQVLVEQGKESRLAAPKRPGAAVAGELSGLESLSDELGNQNLTVSFDYSEEKVDKVSYHISDDNTKFYLTIKPKTGVQPLDSSSVDFSYTGAAADLLVIIGANVPEELGQLYHGYEELYSTTNTVVLANQPSFGSIQLTPEPGDSLTALTLELTSLLNFSLSPDSASNLMYSLEESTQGFRNITSPALFEHVAQLLRSGAVRRWSPKPLAEPPHLAPLTPRSKSSDRKLLAKSGEVVVEKKKTRTRTPADPARG